MKPTVMLADAPVMALPAAQPLMTGPRDCLFAAPWTMIAVSGGA